MSEVNAVIDSWLTTLPDETRYVCISDLQSWITNREYSPSSIDLAVSYFSGDIRDSWFSRNRKSWVKNRESQSRIASRLLNITLPLSLSHLFVIIHDSSSMIIGFFQSQVTIQWQIELWITNHIVKNRKGGSKDDFFLFSRFECFLDRPQSCSPCSYPNGTHEWPDGNE